MPLFFFFPSGCFFFFSIWVLLLFRYLLLLSLFFFANVRLGLLLKLKSSGISFNCQWYNNVCTNDGGLGSLYLSLVCVLHCCFCPIEPCARHHQGWLFIKRLSYLLTSRNHRLCCIWTFPKDGGDISLFYFSSICWHGWSTFCWMYRLYKMKY